MADNSEEYSNLIEKLLGRVRLGEREAVDALFAYTDGRLRKLARRILRGFPRVRHFEQTDDIYQRAVFRIVRSLHSVQPTNLEQFFRLAALQIRRESLDLARHYRRQKLHPGKINYDYSGANLVPDPRDLSIWTEFHELAGELPKVEREVFDLIYYGGLSQAEAANVLGISERTVRDRWRQGRLRLMENLEGQLPGL